MQPVCRPHRDVESSRAKISHSERNLLCCVDLQGVNRVTRPLTSLLAKLAAIGVLAFALGLAACGRKTGLDPPPSAAIDQPSTSGQPTNDTDGRPVNGAKKRLPIDVLIRRIQTVAVGASPLKDSRVTTSAVINVTAMP